jgi:hypothetical protein
MSYITKLNFINYTLVIIIIILFIKGINENHNIPIKSKKIHYIFVTGGFDSTFRLCQLVLIKDRDVQPIYINIPEMDGDEIIRHNRLFELNTLRSIINQLNYIIMNDKSYSHKIFPLIIINKHKINKEVQLNSYKLYETRQLNKPISQYTYMCSIAIDMNKNIETGVLVEKGGPIYKSIGRILISDRIKLSAANKNQLMFRNLLFPLAGMNKSQLKKIAIKNGFLHILKQTISCWFPDSSGQSCGICQMCRERIVL